MLNPVMIPFCCEHGRDHCKSMDMLDTAPVHRVAADALLTNMILGERGQAVDLLGWRRVPLNLVQRSAENNFTHILRWEGHCDKPNRSLVQFTAGSSRPYGQSVFRLLTCCIRRQIDDAGVD